LRDASKNNFIELLITVNTTPQPHQTFPENPDFNALRHEIKDVTNLDTNVQNKKLLVTKII